MASGRCRSDGEHPRYGSATGVEVPDSVRTAGVGGQVGAVGVSSALVSFAPPPRRRWSSSLWMAGRSLDQQMMLSSRCGPVQSSSSLRPVVVLRVTASVNDGTHPLR